MLDTEGKIDRFLVALKTEMMASQMSDGEFGPCVKVEIKQDAGFYSSGDESVFFEGTKRKLITVEIFPKPLVYTTLVSEHGDHSPR
jgi:hypothetical protein